MSEAADAAMIEAADADGRLCDDPLTDRPVDAAAAAERERSAKAAKLAAQTANAMVAVQGQLKLRGKAADKAAHDANAEAGAPVKASSNNSNTHTSLLLLKLMISAEFPRETREETRGCCRETRKGNETG